MSALQGTAFQPKYIGWGTGSGTATANDVGPFQEASEARATGTQSSVTVTTTNDTLQVAGTITAASGETITESILTDSATKPFSTTWSTAPTGTSGTTGTLAASYTPANNSYIQSGTEVMQVTAGSGSTSVTVVRAANGSTASTHSNGDTVTAGNAAGSSLVSNGNLAMHATYTGLALNTGDSLTSTFKLTFA
ncbi:hypothetical protein ACWGCW_00940 [Streptomyces sp. NPDC054933]